MIKRYPGFTIVELLIVIVVIAILAAITVTAFSGVTQRSQVQKANTDLVTLVKAIRLARLSQNKVLKDITGNSCTFCGTQATYELSLDRISAASGVNLAALKVGNPWGNKYSIDENELENMTVNNGCNKDTVGPGTGAPAGQVTSPVIPTYSC